MKKLNCLLVHNGLTKSSPPKQEHLPRCKLFFPKPSALMVMATPQEFAAGKASLCALPWSHFLFETEGSQSKVPACTYAHACSHTHAHSIHLAEA